ncbi:MAG: PEP-CTERM sorting domain-containing protein [Phycisphaerales bacterium]|nr:PEP-CTERM sorting domain-containing protein [Phycisphaerales bacterium]
MGCMLTRGSCGVAWSVVVGALAAAGSAQALNFQVDFDGSINGDQISASGSGSLDRSGTGQNFAEIGFDNLPSEFSPFAVDVMLTNVCPNGFRADGSSDNLWDLAHGSYSIERTFQWLGVPGSLVTATAEVTFDDELQTLHSSMHFSGNYHGPTDLVAIDDYSVLWLPSSAEGEIFEAGTAIARRANGEQLIVQFATRYFGLDSSLGQTQVGIGDIDASFDGQTLTIGWDGYFEVPAPGALALFGVGILGVRRRRA